MMAKKINLDEIDESFVIAAVKKDKSTIPANPERLLQPLPAKTAEHLEAAIEETAPAAVPPGQPKEESKRKRKTQDYESLFIRESSVTARLGKTVYIRKEFHDRILKIIQVIGGNEVSLFSYIDNVLTHHFDAFQEDISQAYKQQMKDDVF
jgi:hypothetical protein